MNVLITGANGFVGKNMTQRLSTIKDRRDRTGPYCKSRRSFYVRGILRQRPWRTTAKRQISWSIWLA